jgi:hypothetical protein
MRGRGLGRESRAVGDTGRLGALACRVDRARVVVGADERRLRKGLRHQDRRGAVPAAEVRDARPTLELLRDALECREPRVDQVRVVAGAEEALAALVDVVHVLVPAEPAAALHGLRDPRRVDDRPDGDLEEPGQIGRARLVRERHRLLRCELVRAALGVVLDVAARRLGVQPFPDVALGRRRPRRQLLRRERAGVCHRPVEPELVAHHDERRVQRRPHLVDGAEDELHQLLLVQRARSLDRGHLVTSCLSHLT